MKKLFFLASLVVAATASTTLTSCNSTEAKSNTEKPVANETEMYEPLDNANLNASVFENRKWMLGTTEQVSTINTITNDLIAIQPFEGSITKVTSTFVVSDYNCDLMSSYVFTSYGKLVTAYIQKYGNGTYAVILNPAFGQSTTFVNELTAKIKTLVATSVVTTTPTNKATVEPVALETITNETGSFTRKMFIVNPGTLTTAQLTEFSKTLSQTVADETDRGITQYKIKLWL